MANFLGKKISLISKAGIRYEGILYTIDPGEATVALSKVKSFGTEDRVPERYIPPRDEVYEYIIFRGSDIKDLHVCENSLYSEDSAIMPPPFTSHSPMHASMAQHVVDDGVSGMDFHLKTNQNECNNRMYQKTSASIMASSNNLESDIVDKSTATTTSFSDLKPLQTGKNHENTPSQPLSSTSEARQKKIDNLELDKIVANDYCKFLNREQRNKAPVPDDDQQHQHQYHDYNNFRRGGDSGRSSRGMRNHHQDSRAGSQYHVVGHNGIPPNRNYRSSNNNREVTVDSIKEDFDFETSNAILAKELENINVSNEIHHRNKSVAGTGGGSTTVSANAAVINTSGIGTKDLTEMSLSDYEEEKPYYDKARSFFDNISSEMSERNNSDRRNDRRSNSETFGDPNHSRSNRGNRWNSGRRGQFRGNPGRGISAGFLRRGNNFNRGGGGESRGRGQSNTTGGESNVVNKQQHFLSVGSGGVGGGSRGGEYK